MLFDVVNPLQHSGLSAIRKRGQEWFSSFQGPLEFETQQLSVAASDDLEGMKSGFEAASA